MQSFAQLPEIALITIVIATVIFSSGFSILRLHRRFGRKTRYALKIRFTLWALIGYAVLSGVLSLLFSLASPNRLGDIANTIPGAILLAFSSSIIVVAATSTVGVKTKDQRSLISVANWVYDTIDPEIERLVNQEIVDIAMRLKARPGAYETLFEVGRCWVAICPQFEKRKIRIQFLARIEEFSSAGVGDGVLVRFVGFLLNDCECDPHWIEKKVNEAGVISSGLVFESGNRQSDRGV